MNLQDEVVMANKKRPPRDAYPNLHPSGNAINPETQETPDVNLKSETDQPSPMTDEPSPPSTADLKRAAKIRKAILSDLRLVPAKALREWVADRITPEEARAMALDSQYDD